ncbi:hypothetical protein [Arthrobacter cheniae]|uniref:hypothetical protein n=1 Tax=Arthrobacter cheniae TaxID=1258888 RepID=UPI0016026CF6|nr:hypothetical protein [Arthrobacter cheniae]
MTSPFARCTPCPVLLSGTTLGGTGIGGTGEVPAATGLRLREVMALQQALHNAHLPAHTDRLILIGNLIGRTIGSLPEVWRHELRPLLRSLTALSAQNED